MFFHAHPDDEALLTAGTMARLAAEGHRVVLVIATAGEQGLTSGGEQDLGELRVREAHASARILGCARVEFLGYGDSGSDGEPPPGSFAATSVESAAERLAELLRQERAELLTTYDPAGGYGHPDHVQVHHVGALAARLAGTPLVLEATVNRDLLLRGIGIAGLVHRFPPKFDRSNFETAYSSGAEITHRVNVRKYTSAKRRSMAAHVSQTSGGESTRTLAGLLGIPAPLFRFALGTEWYVQRDLPPGKRLAHPLARLV